MDKIVEIINQDVELEEVDKEIFDALALEHNIVTMKDWINETDELLKFRIKHD